ncbi:murein transglycosylase A [Methyloferula stellata]|uniref:murein transglycosylase A n=1 Tax=Methyloferula stellata TaxID=876270 RepID=UPI000361491F|nr:MltA domain-containing protein [Methyloferula stellata]
MIRGFLTPPEMSQDAVPFAALDGFDGEDCHAAFRAFLVSCKAIVENEPALRPAADPAPSFLKTVCLKALAEPASNAREARQFFETFFAPHRIRPKTASGAGFVTAYYEPVVEGSLAPHPDFAAPILGRPDSLVDLRQSESLAGAAAPFLEPYPDRAAIDAGALEGRVKPLVWVKDKVEAFFIHVQGSARVKLRDGAEVRLTYAGRNGHPYTSIGRILVVEHDIPPEKAGLTGLKDWIRTQGQGPGEAGAALMLRNKSYIFFALTEVLRPEEGPIGGQGVSLTAFRSIALDRAIWPYGLPMWIDAEIPWQSPASSKFRRLMIGQDTGSAIVGAARGDLYFGSGDAAGALAGAIRHKAEFTVLLPRDLDGSS